MEQATSWPDPLAPTQRPDSEVCLARPADEPGWPERPALAPDVQLVGELQDGGFQERQWLIQRGGHFLQVSELLYRIAEQADGQRTLEAIADAVTASSDWLLTPETVGQIVQSKLIPLGVVASGVPTAERARAQPLALGMNLRARTVGPRVIDPIARVLQFLYIPAVLGPMLMVIAIAHEWLYIVHGMARSFASVLYTPALVLAALAVLILGNVFHEFGHASALRYGGGRARGMGVGLYLIYPAFYTDTTESYRLGRWARVRTDLGGFYFHLIFATIVVGIYWLLRQEWLLVVVFAIDFDILYQLLPFVRFDGYWAFADLTGIPDFFSQMVPFVRSFLPLRPRRGAYLPALKPWVKLTFLLYMIVTVPILAVLGLLMVVLLPHLASMLWESLRLQFTLLSAASRHGDLAHEALAAVQIGLLVLQAFGVAYLLLSLGRQVSLAALRWSRSALARQRRPVAAG